jgi:capsular exopolysaccharide synthesis family protein
MPINISKKTKAAGGLAFGFMFGIMIVLVWEMMDRTIKTADDIKGHLKLNVLGAIPQVAFDNVNDFQDHEKARMMDQQLVTHDFAPTPIGEAYRSLRPSIIYNTKTGRLQTLVLTSTAPGDGKSFTAANLGIALAQQKSKTLLVDTDLRRGVQHNTFGVPKEPGFSNYLCGQVISADIVNETHIPNLAMISCGSLVPNPSELLGSLQMRRFLDEMRRKFDVIIFDTPPLNAATDAVVLGTQVDGVAIVVRAGKTHREVARQKLELFQNLEAKIIGVVLNGTSVDLAHEGYSYYHY